MSFFFGKRQSTKPAYSGVQIQTSSQDVGLTIAWGQNRFAPNVIWYGDFASHKHKQKAGKGGGKVTSYTYSASFQMALCEGPIDSIGRVWKDQDTSGTLSSLGITLFDGSYTQAPWGYLSTAHPSAALAYRGVAYVAAANFDLGDSASLPQFSYEVASQLYGTGYSNAYDADCALIVQDFLTNVNYGVLFPGQSISTDTLLSTAAATGVGDRTYQTYCRAMGWGLSPVLSEPESASGIIDRWMKITNTALVWTGYTLKFVPQAYGVLTAHGVTYNPDITPVYTLTDDDYISDNEDPVKLSRTAPEDCKNSVRFIIADRDHQYNKTPAPWKDQGLIDQYGLLQDTDFSADEITDLTMAGVCVTLYGKRGAYIRNTFTVTVGVEYSLLEAMDIVEITDPQLGTILCEVRKITEQDDSSFELEVSELQPSVSVTAGMIPQSSGGYVPNTGVAAGPINTPILFEPPANLSSGAAQVWAAVSGGNNTTVDPNWGGANVFVSADGGATYQQVGQILTAARQGKLTTSLASYSGANPDSTHTVGVDLSMSNGDLQSVTSTEAANGTTLCVIQDAGGTLEFLSFATATLTATNRYTLASLYRGLYQTTGSSHLSGVKFARLDENIFEFDLPKAYVGTPLKFKFQSFNIWGNGLQDLAACVEYSYTPSGAGFAIAAPTSPVLTFSSAQQADGTNIITGQLAWTASAGPYLDHYEAAYTTDGGTTWQTLPNVGSGAVNTTFAPALASTNYQARVRAVSSANDANPSSWATSSVVNSGALSSTAPNAPTGLTGAGAILANNLSWTAPSSGPRPDGYYIYGKLGASGTISSATLLGTASGLNWTHSGLGTSQTWRYWVEAYNFAGPSSPAGPLDLTTSSSNGGVEVDLNGSAVVTGASKLNFSGTGITVTNPGGGQANITLTPYYRVGAFATTSPSANEVLLLHPATDAFTLAANLAGSVVKVGSNPAATFALSVTKNGTTVGTISISTSGVVTLTTTGGTTVVFAAGDLLSIVAPATPDASIANLAISLRGTM